MTTLIFVRHGQSESNLERRFTGQHETSLTELGRAQAAATADFLANEPIDRIYASDLSRAIETAEPTARMHGLTVIPCPDFREINAGLWEGKPYDYLRETFGASYERWITDLGHAHPEGGERVLELAARVYAATERILTEERGRTVAIFTHATPVRMLACRWFGIAPENAREVPFCTNASVSKVEYDDDGSFRLIYYAHDGHQGELVTGLPKGVV